jgi:putative ABC transport system permease protein
VLGWTFGLVRRSLPAVAGAALAIGLAVAFVASLTSFVAASRADLTSRAAGRLPVDWQVQVTAYGDVAEVDRQTAALPDLRAHRPVDYAAVPGLEAAGAAGTRTTGQAQVVSLPADYAGTFPGEIRPLVGATTGVLLTQQTAANLAVVPGDRFSVQRPDGSLAILTVDGVVELPAADSFFQVVGAPANAGATAPPDNVVLVPPDRFPAVTAGSPVVHQIHIGFDHAALPADPAAAAIAVQQRANHLEVAVAGGALIGDNLGAALSAARQDALYSLLLVLLLGAPGVALATVVAALVVALRGERRRREVALLRLRGATPGSVLALVGGETALSAVLGGALGLLGALAAVRLALPAGARLGTGGALLGLGAGVAVAVATQLGPAAWGMLRGGGGGGGGGGSVRVAAAGTLSVRSPWPLHIGLDVLLLAGAAVTFWLTSRGGYQVVLAPEGVTSTSVNYAALLAPALAWPGLALLVWRITAAALSRRTGRLARDTPGRAPELTAASLRRRRQVVARGATGLAVALGLAASTAVFTATYDKQATLDVALTVGADVAVTEPPGSAVPPSAAAGLAQAPGVRAVEPLVHRFAYVGPDLQDVYGIDPAGIERVAPLRDSFTPGSTIRQALDTLGRTPDGVLLSAETLHDYQLRPGDLVRLRLQTGTDRAYRPVDFHVVGLVTEFPTAPKDSFIVANAGYLAAQTGSDLVGTFLISSSDPVGTAAAVRDQVAGSGAIVSDVQSARSTVTSATGLAAADLGGLSRLELGFGVLLALACSALALLLGVAQRRRALVLLAALGATARQRGRFLSADAWGLLVGGLLGGVAVAATISYLLVKVLTGIFDPPPSSAALPLGYLTALAGVVVVASVAVVAAVGRLASRAGPAELRDL